VQVEPGDSIVFYSDGVTEAASPEGEEFGEDRLGAFVAGRPNLEVAELITEISSAVNTFTKGAPLADDLTLLIARRGV
jgi:phosphoserine phosphatase RsbU/P